MTARTVRTSEAPQPAGAYSQGRVVDGLLFTAGFGPQDPATGEIAADVGGQTRQVLRNLAAVLAVEGATLAEVVKVTAHLQDLDRDFAAYDAAYRECFSPPYPVRTTVGSTLAGILVEIDVVAAVDREVPSAR